MVVVIRNNQIAREKQNGKYPRDLDAHTFMIALQTSAYNAAKK
jgi:hypothetical protein